MTPRKPKNPRSQQPAPESWQCCSWHHGYALCVLVRIIEQGSGPGGALYACADCRTEHGLVPVSTQTDGPTSTWTAAGAAS